MENQGIIDGYEVRLNPERFSKNQVAFIIVTVDSIVDHRVRATDFRAETTLTKDTVPVNVDAIAFWVVWDARMSVLEVASYQDAVILSAQTALRDAIGEGCEE